MSSFETPPGWEFYDLSKDPREMNNLYGEEEYATIITDLKVRLKALRAKVGEDDTARCGARPRTCAAKNLLLSFAERTIQAFQWLLIRAEASPARTDQYA